MPEGRMRSEFLGVISKEISHLQRRKGNSQTSNQTPEFKTLTFFLHPLSDPCLPRLLSYLLLSSYLRLSLASSHISPKEKSIAYEVEERKQCSGVLTPKELKTLQTRVQARISREEGVESGKWSSRKGVELVSNTSYRPAAAGPTSSKSKKAKVSSSSSSFGELNPKERHHLLPNDSKVDYLNETVSENGGGVYEIDREAWLRVNYHGFDLNIRDEKIVELVEGSYNEQTGKVLREVLKFAREKEDEARKRGGDEEAEENAIVPGGRELSGESSDR